MTTETHEPITRETQSSELIEPRPFPFNQRTFCNYEPVEKSINQARVLIVDNLLRNEDDLSEVARADWGKNTSVQLKRERQIADLALQNIVANVERLVKQPETRIVHVTALAKGVTEFQPHAIVLSGTLRQSHHRISISSGAHHRPQRRDLCRHRESANGHLAGLHKGSSQPARLAKSRPATRPRARRLHAPRDFIP